MELYKGKYWELVFYDNCQEFPGQSVFLSSKETNVNQINTLTTSINSKSNNSLSNNPISSFKMSKSSIKTSSFSTHPVNYNNLNNFNSEEMQKIIY